VTENNLDLGMSFQHRIQMQLKQGRGLRRHSQQASLSRHPPNLARPGDVIPAPDSEAAKTGKGPLETEPTGQPEQTSTPVIPQQTFTPGP